MAKKLKKYADGGILITPQTSSNPTYPFPSNGTSMSSTPASGLDSGVNQTFNIQPTASAAGQPQAQAPFKKGGKVSAASKRADGCAVRGKTRA